MSYNYQSFVIQSTQANPAINQFLEKMKEFVPNINVEGPFYYKDNSTDPEVAKSYIITHTLDNSFKLVITNQEKLLEIDGKPNMQYGSSKVINVQVIVDEKIRSLGGILLGSIYGSYGTAVEASLIYVTLVASDNYLLWAIDVNPPSSCVSLRVVYMPIYQKDNSTYGLIYPGMEGFVKEESYKRYILTYKDTLLTNGKTTPTKSTYGICLELENRFCYPKIDITQPATLSNFKPILTTQVPLFISTHYGDNYPISGEYVRRIDTEFYSRECFLLISYGQNSNYPVGSILTLDDKDYYVIKAREEYSNTNCYLLRLFEL